MINFFKQMISLLNIYSRGSLEQKNRFKTSGIIIPPNTGGGKRQVMIFLNAFRHMNIAKILRYLHVETMKA